MNKRKTHRPNWDDAAWMMRTDPEREPKPRLAGAPINITVPDTFNVTSACAAWAAIGVRNSPEWIISHAEQLRTWQQRHPVTICTSM